MNRTASSRTLFALVLVVSVACTPSGAQTEPPAEASGPPATERQAELINHITPRRDSVGAVPTRFEWSAVNGADEYAIGLWNESDTMLWRQGGITEPNVPMPRELTLEPGTYFWSVTGVKDGRPIAESGLSAFVVMPPS